jgi:prophage DNA circulation protein
MRYKGYVWPYNPRTYTIAYERKMAVNKIPFGRYHLQELGLTRRVLKGEGEFEGEDAYTEFKKLAYVFYDPGPGTLVHPIWQTTQAYFVELSLKQEPRRDYVRYAFTFWETYDGYRDTVIQATVAGDDNTSTNGSTTGAVYHTVTQGDTLWAIAGRYNVSLSTLVSLNPQIKNPNFVLVGEKVRVR